MRHSSASRCKDLDLSSVCPISGTDLAPDWTMGHLGLYTNWRIAWNSPAASIVQDCSVLMTGLSAPLGRLWELGSTRDIGTSRCPPSSDTKR